MQLIPTRTLKSRWYIRKEGRCQDQDTSRNLVWGVWWEARCDPCLSAVEVGGNYFPPVSPCYLSVGLPHQRVKWKLAGSVPATNISLLSTRTLTPIGADTDLSLENSSSREVSVKAHFPSSWALFLAKRRGSELLAAYLINRFGLFILTSPLFSLLLLGWGVQ